MNAETCLFLYVTVTDSGSYGQMQVSQGNNDHRHVAASKTAHTTFAYLKCITSRFCSNIHISVMKQRFMELIIEISQIFFLSAGRSSCCLWFGFLFFGGRRELPLQIYSSPFSYIYICIFLQISIMFLLYIYIHIQALTMLEKLTESTEIFLKE